MKQRGFSIIETIAAVVILSGAVAMVASSASQTVRTVHSARMDTIGTYLADEAIEYVRNVAAANSLNDQSVDSGLTQCVGTECQLNIWSSTDVLSVCNGSCDVFINTDGQYGADGGASGFTRSLQLVAMSNPHEYKVLVTVGWVEYGRDRSINEEFYIYGN